MSIEPVEIQHVKLHKRLFGYAPDETERLLEEVTASFERVWLERDALRAQVERLESELDRSRGRDREVADVLVRAQRIAEKRLAETRKRAEEILTEAREQAARALAEAEHELGRRQEELARLESSERAVRERYRAFVSGAQRLLDDEPAAVGHDGSADLVDRVRASSD